ncbi:FHIPEP family type III secretion protein [Escherichia coli]
MVLLVAMFTQRTLEFAAFPTILLFTTLLRLALNVASTRIILMEGAYRRGGGREGGRSVRSLPRWWQFRYRYRGVCHSRDHQLYGHYQRCRAYRRSGCALLFSMVCRVSRWRLTPTLTPD